MAESKKSENIFDSNEWKALKSEADEMNKLHLKDLLVSSNKECDKRNECFIVKHGDITLDCSRQKASCSTFSKLLNLCKKSKLKDKIQSMFNGDKINITENRRVLHVALRAKRDDKILGDNNVNEVERVWNVLDKIKEFSNKVRNGEWKGFSGKKLTNVISIGIGGSYLGCEFVYESLKTYSKSKELCKGRRLKFYANIDPIGFERAISELDPETTLAIVVSKSFTTRETMMNANLIRQWLINSFDGNEKCLTNHFVAVSANPELPIQKFNVDKNNIFEFWDWVGGRYSVTSAVGILPLSLHFGFEMMLEFLQGANDIDVHFRDTELNKNIPIILGLFGVWNSTFLGYKARALIPYCEALCRLPAHIQQLDMESNGKSVDKNSNYLNFDCGEIDFGEPGTNAQHSFFQLIHQGTIVPIDFIAFCKSQLVNYNLYKNNKTLLKLIKNNHDELLSNCFAQADSLAIGKNEDKVKESVENKENENIIPHKVFSGNRPSSILLFKNELNPFQCGQLLSIFEHRTATQGFLWNICSFDQWGVELGKIMGKKVRKTIDQFRNKEINKVDEYPPSTNHLLTHYLQNSDN